MFQFHQLLKSSQRNSLLCVGLDPDANKLPAGLPLFDFVRAIVDATAHVACAFKPQFAHFAAAGAEDDLKRIIHYIKENHADIPVILDAKRGDIGSTAALYAREVFARYNADAVTVNPYLGFDSLLPFLEYDGGGRGVFVLCRTSNAGSGEVQALTDVDGVSLAHRIAMRAAELYRHNRNIGLVVGATWPEEVAAIRRLVGDMQLLIPGIGAQGGDLPAVLDAGLTACGDGVLINASRSIMYAGGGGDFAEAAGRAAEELWGEINGVRWGF